MSVNPIDTKVRNRTYDDAPGMLKLQNSKPSDIVLPLQLDYYNFVPKPFHIIGFDGAGTVLDVAQTANTLSLATTFLRGGDDSVKDLQLSINSSMNVMWDASRRPSTLWNLPPCL